MSDEIKPKVDESKLPATTEELVKAKNHLNQVAQIQLDKFGGDKAVKGHNPHLWIAEKVTPLLNALAVKDCPKSVVTAALGVKEEPPVATNQNIPTRIVDDKYLRPTPGATPAAKKGEK